MATLHLLGTGAALSTSDRTTTMLAFSDEESLILVDCGGDAVQRLFAADLNPNHLKVLFITHAHIDHVGGFPLLMEKLWLNRHPSPIPLYGLAPALQQTVDSFKVYDSSNWEGLQEIQCFPVEEREGVLAYEDDLWTLTVAPGLHALPVLGLRVENKRTGGVVTYSSDTEPCEAIERLAQGSQILVFEATGLFPGHTSPQQAAAIARTQGVEKLLLVHLPRSLNEADLSEARTIFPQTFWGHDLDAFPF